MMKDYYVRFAHLLLCVILLIMTICACEYSMPRPLTEADSLMQRGNLNQADSLLEAYDNTGQKSSKRVQMYRALLALERRYVADELTSKDFSIADSLARYYSEENTCEAAMSQLFLGDIYQKAADYPSALACFLKAEKQTKALNNKTLLIWSNRMLGDIYFEQRMLQECTKYYREQFKFSKETKDTLRMALGAFAMARVSMINNYIDSSVYYLNKSIEWASKHQRSNTIIPAAQSKLADIYIQTKQFEKAASIMPHNSMNDENWAYWHLDQQHTDSAIFYFKGMLGKYGWRAQVTYLQILANLEESKGNKSNAFEYYKELNIAKDSLKNHSKTEESLQIKSQYEYNIIKSERDKITARNKRICYMFGAISLLTVVVGVAVNRSWQSYKDRKEKEIIQEKLRRKEEERRNKHSLIQIVKNSQRIAELEQQVLKAQENADKYLVDKLKLETRLLKAENEIIKTKKHQQSIMQEALEQSSLYHKIKGHAGEENFHLSDEEWQELGSMIDDANDQFTFRLRNIHDGITPYELHICYLLKLKVSSTNIGIMLFKSKAAIGMTRQRLYKKLTGKVGTAKQLNDFILNF